MFIELTIFGEDRPVLINIDNITQINPAHSEADHKATCIGLNGNEDDTLWVNEPYSDVRETIEFTPGIVHVLPTAKS